MGEESKPKWEDKVTVEVRSSGEEQVWAVLEDFCNIHKWSPILDTCYQVEGVQGKPGLIRYCASTTKVSVEDEPAGTTTIKWVKEKLLSIDPIKRCLSYEIVDNNMGFKSYVATLKVIPIYGETVTGCGIEWEFICDPVEGWTLQDFNSYIQSCLQFMAKKIEVECSVTKLIGKPEKDLVMLE